ncbi:unnamed protein product [Timema podura]|uniref:Uncharacterized protein n=1 Tax=Timema podura TaxID=61482 RepID=A0ABN7NGY6_TIMPD|nr:unnamed protein product [Timema podura]
MTPIHHELRKQHPDLDFLIAHKLEARRDWQTHRTNYNRLRAQERKRFKDIRRQRWDSYVTEAALDRDKGATRKKTVPVIHGENGIVYGSTEMAEAIAMVL